MTAHPHAALMMEYARDAATRPDPWALYEWREGPRSEWQSMSVSPQWRCAFQYRCRPQSAECWINLYTWGFGNTIHASYDDAVTYANPECLRKAVHFREVTDNE